MRRNAGGAVSVTHGIQELIHPEPAERFVVGYVVLAVSFVLEGISFLQSVRQARSEAESLQRDLIEHVIVTSDPTLRAVFAEDSAALTGLVIAAAGLGDAPAALQDSALIMIDCQNTYRRGVMQLEGAENARLQTATLAGIADLFAVVAGTPDDVPG